MSVTEKIEAIGDAILQFVKVALPVVAIVWALFSTNAPSEESLWGQIQPAVTMAIAVIAAGIVLWLELKRILAANELAFQERRDQIQYKMLKQRVLLKALELKYLKAAGEPVSNEDVEALQDDLDITLEGIGED